MLMYAIICFAFGLAVLAHHVAFPAPRLVPDLPAELSDLFRWLGVRRRIVSLARALDGSIYPLFIAQCVTGFLCLIGPSFIGRGDFRLAAIILGLASLLHVILLCYVRSRWQDLREALRRHQELAAWREDEPTGPCATTSDIIRAVNEERQARNMPLLDPSRYVREPDLRN